MRSLTLASAVAVGLLAVGCSNGDQPTMCQKDTDCTATMRCDTAKKICVKRATCPEMPCASGETCLTGRCYANNCGSTMCAADQVCSSPVNGHCIDQVCI